MINELQCVQVSAPVCHQQAQSNPVFLQHPWTWTRSCWCSQIPWCIHRLQAQLQHTCWCSNQGSYSTCAFLSRNLSHCSRKIKETSYKTFVRPIAEYAASAWDPHTQRNIKKVEQIQCSSARFVTGNYDRTCSVTAMVQDLQWSTLADRRHISRLVMMYCIPYDLIDISWFQYLIPLTSRTRGHASRFLCPQCSSSIYFDSFFPCTTRDWNVLKSDPATSASLIAFKTAPRGNLTT